MDTFEMEYNFDDIPTTFESRFCVQCNKFRIEEDESGNKRFVCTVLKTRPYAKDIVADEFGNPVCKHFKEL